MKKKAFLMLSAMIVMLTANVCAINYGLTHYNLNFVDEVGRPITDSLTVTVYIAGSSSDTIYSDAAKTAMDNPATVTSGKLSFWTASRSIDVRVSDGTNTIKKSTLDTTEGLIMFPLREYEFTEALVSGTLTTTGDVDFGSDGSGVDVTFYADTASDYMLWDQSADSLLFVGGIADFDDDSIINLGSGDDATLQFDGTNLELFAAAADTPFAIGGTTKGFDLTYYFETSGTIATDYDGDSLTFSDNMSLVFGSGADASIMYDETTDDNLEIAVGSAGIGVTADDVIFTTDGATANQFKVDATGTAAGNVIVLETTDGGVQINADGAANGDIAIDAADDMTLTAAGDLTFAVSGNIKGNVAGDGTDTFGGYLKTVTVDIDDRVVAVTESGNVFTNGADTDTSVFTLPSAAAGLIYTFCDVEAGAAADLCIKAGTGDKIQNGNAAAYYNCYDDTYGSMVTLVAVDDTEWVVVATNGTWTADSDTDGTN